ncbi:MAG: hypothetical protein O3A85_12215 [Proteobacteria bacterium]|nr:hypothetical protein [Pseudomonadota bacterium]
MTKLLEEAIEKARLLPADRQNDAAEILLTVVEQSGANALRLTKEQAAEVRSRLGDRQYASDEEVAAFFRQAGA